MPVVRARREVAPGELPGARLTAAETAVSQGAAVAEARGQTAEAFGRVAAGGAAIGVQIVRGQEAERRRLADEAKRRADQMAAIAYDNQLAGWTRDHLYDPESGALNIKGKDAFDLPERIDSEFETFASEQAQVAGTPEQEVAFARIRAERQQRIGLDIRRHVDQQIEAYNTSEFKAAVSNAVELSIAQADNPEAAHREMVNGERALAGLGDFLKLGPEQRDQQAKEYRSAVTVGIINRLLGEGKTMAARAYFEETKGLIAGDKIDEVNRALRAGTTKGEAQAAFDQILGAGGTLAEQRDKAKKITDPDVRDQVLTYLEHEQTVKDRAAREADETRSRTFYNVLDATQGNLRSIVGTPEWVAMSGDQRSAIRHYAKFIADGTEPETNLKAYYGLVQTALDEPETFSRMNLWDFRSKLGKSDFEEFARLQLSLRNAERNQSEPTLNKLSTFTQMFNGAAASMRVDPDSDEAQQVRRQWERLVDAEERQTGKKLSNPDIQQRLDRLIMETTAQRPGWFGGMRETDVRGFELTIEDVPRGMRRTLLDELRRVGVPDPEDEQIIDMYLRMLQRRQRQQKR